MIVIPAIDIINGKVVRLAQGDYDKKTEYKTSPLNQARCFERAGYTRLHIVDLDGAKTGVPPNIGVIKKIAQNTRLKVQVGGGIRKRESARELFASGVSKAVVGTVAVKEPETLRALVKEFGADKIIVSLDVKKVNGAFVLAYDGWLKYAGLTPLLRFIENLQAINIQEVICTDIAKDGMLKGPNLELYETIVRRFPSLSFTSAGGVRSKKDIDNLKKVGVRKVIVGKAMYEKLC